MNAMLPITSPEHYLTGTSAMAIPSETTSFVDWHFVDAFLGGKADFRVSGVSFPDTAKLLGREGVRECGETLRRCGVDLPRGRLFYAASRDSAFLDLVVGNLLSGRRFDHLRLDDYCDGEKDSAQLRGRMESLRGLLDDAEQAERLDEWLSQQ